MKHKNKKQDNIKCNKQLYFFRNLKKFNNDSFIDNLQSSTNNFQHSLSFNYSNEVEKLFSNFIELVTMTINMHAPLIKASHKKRELMNKPWITKGFNSTQFEFSFSFNLTQTKFIHKFLKNGTEIEKLLYILTRI